MSQQDDLVAAGRRLLTNNYRQAPIVFARGEGCALFDVEGRRYLDMTAGIAVCVLGHGAPGPGGRHRRPGPPPAARLEPLLHRAAAAAGRGAVAARLPGPGVLLQLGHRGQRSGAEARPPLPGRRARDSRERIEIVAFESSFHGRTMGALSVTGQPKYREGFGPLVRPVRFVPFGDVGRRARRDHRADLRRDRRADPGARAASTCRRRATCRSCGAPAPTRAPS